MAAASGNANEAARPGGFFACAERPLLVDSITEAVGRGVGRLLISGSHGGLSAARYALQAGARLAAFNDAGIGKDEAGIAALRWLQPHGVAAVAVAHHSACIGDAASTWNDGLISAVNEAAAALGARPGQALRIWLREAGAGEPERVSAA